MTGRQGDWVDRVKLSGQPECILLTWLLFDSHTVVLPYSHTGIQTYHNTVIHFSVRQSYIYTRSYSHKGVQSYSNTLTQYLPKRVQFQNQTVTAPLYFLAIFKIILHQDLKTNTL